MRVHRAVISVLAGQVFPRPRWCLRWRLRLFGVFITLNKWLPLVPRRRRFSLLTSEPVEWTVDAGAAAAAAQAVGS
jgi:hypothetical protein